MNRLLLLAFVCVAAFAQTAPKLVRGVISEFKPEDLVVVVKPDNADAVNVKLTPETIFKRVAPGSSSLKDAADMKMTDMALGDQVLVSFKPGTMDAVRVVIMSATDITKRNEADRLDWTKRGLSGVVTSKKDGVITLKMRGMGGETVSTVTVNDKTTYHRYKSDSVKFADALVSKLDEISVGDQLRARGAKSDDGSKVAAEEVVFGTFITKAGTITAINAETKEVTVAEIGTNKPLVIKFTADSQIKKMPQMGPGMGGGMGGPGGMAAGRGGPPGAGGPGAGRMPDISQMLDRMPGAKLDDLRAGEKIVVSSTKGANPGEVTAIMLLGNADMLIQMATVPAAGGRGAGGGPGAGGMGMGGLQSLDLPSMIMN
jgi:hypothetical protein